MIEIKEKMKTIKAKEKTKVETRIKKDGGYWRNHSEEARERLLKFALKQVGKKYKWGVRKYEMGKYWDCSSINQYLYKRIGIDLPRTTILQAYHGNKIPARKTAPFFKEKDLKIGDLLFFKSKKGHFTPEFYDGIGHVAMYIGDGKFLSVEGDIPVYSYGIEGTFGKKKYISTDNKKEGVLIVDFSKIVNRKDFQIAKRILD